MGQEDYLVVKRVHRSLKRLFSSVFPTICGVEHNPRQSTPNSDRPRNADSKSTPRSGLGWEGKARLGLTKKPTKTNRNLEKTDTKDIKSGRSYENMLGWSRKVTSKYLKTRDSNLRGI